MSITSWYRSPVQVPRPTASTLTVLEAIGAKADRKGRLALGVLVGASFSIIVWGALLGLSMGLLE